MANYDFRCLSPHDFELLSRDLLQEELAVRLESFSAGPDSGIDFRHCTPSDTLIVQCKHYADSGFPALLRAVQRKERPKLEALQPTRYILATSVPLTPARKTSLLDALHPHCLTESDIVGREDVNNLLVKHQHIEQRHFKLWLTSSALLERVVNSGIFSDSELHLDRVRLRLSRYVPNDSFPRARQLLDTTRFCIIAGIPGIGKTTLAEVLLADLVDRQGFKPFRVAHDLSELRRIKNPQSKQVFYFDDFLGKTSLAKLQKNEDQRLIELMQDVAANPNWRFLLTTREYILNIARRQYEAFAQPSIDFTVCVIQLSDYTRPVRAKILYNHIYFSDLPTEYKLALLDGRGYEDILTHRNYNPRVVEYMTQSSHARSVGPTLYKREFVDSLNNPARIWDHAFRHQISEAARHLLLVLATLPHMTRLEDLHTAFWTFYNYRRSRFGFSTTPQDWDNAIRELDGNFLSTQKVGDDIVVSFHSPYVRDFMEQFLATSHSDVWDLANGASFYEQYTSLWTGLKGRRYKGIHDAGIAFVRLLESDLDASSASVIRVTNSQGEVIGVRVSSPSQESRAEFFLRVVDGLQLANAEPLVQAVLARLGALWKKGRADRQDLFRLLQELTKRGMDHNDASFIWARQCLLTFAEELEHFLAAIKFCEAYPTEVSEDDRYNLGAGLRVYAREYLDECDDDDPDRLREVAMNLEYAGHALRVDVDDVAESLNERAEEIETELAENEPPDDYDEDRTYSREQVEDIHGMFDSLRSDLLNG